jgi:hypothetical protein
MHHVRNISRFVLALGLCALLASCTLREYVYIYNNTGKPVEVMLTVDGKKKVISINPGAIEFSSVGKLADGDILSVAVNDSTWNYRLVKADSKFWSYEGAGPFSKITYRMQIEGDGKIYILPRGADLPLKSLPNQPRGYPLLPTNES